MVNDATHQSEMISAAVARIPAVTLVPPHTARGSAGTTAALGAAVRITTQQTLTHLELDIEINNTESAIERARTAAAVIERLTTDDATAQVAVTVRIVSVTT